MLKINTVYILMTRFNHTDVCTTPLWRNWGELKIIHGTKVSVKEKESMQTFFKLRNQAENPETNASRGISFSKQKLKTIFESPNNMSS